MPGENASHHGQTKQEAAESTRTWRARRRTWRRAAPRRSVA
uniref:Uncharacterized protein n=1 Tax=Arundo donax TaxID=35708 RepID=A0A0A9DGZ6_ARUDO